MPLAPVYARVLPGECGPGRRRLSLRRQVVEAPVPGPVLRARPGIAFLLHGRQGRWTRAERLPSAEQEAWPGVASPAEAELQAAPVVEVQLGQWLDVGLWSQDPAGHAVELAVTKRRGSPEPLLSYAGWPLVTLLDARVLLRQWQAAGVTWLVLLPDQVPEQPSSAGQRYLWHRRTTMRSEEPSSAPEPSRRIHLVPVEPPRARELPFVPPPLPSPPPQVAPPPRRAPDADPPVRAYRIDRLDWLDDEVRFTKSTGRSASAHAPGARAVFEPLKVALARRIRSRVTVQAEPSEEGGWTYRADLPEELLACFASARRGQAIALQRRSSAPRALRTVLRRILDQEDVDPAQILEVEELVPPSRHATLSHLFELRDPQVEVRIHGATALSFTLPARGGLHAPVVVEHLDEGNATYIFRPPGPQATAALEATVSAGEPWRMDLRGDPGAQRALGYVGRILHTEAEGLDGWKRSLAQLLDEPGG